MSEQVPERSFAGVPFFWILFSGKQEKDQSICVRKEATAILGLAKTAPILSGV